MKKNIFIIMALLVIAGNISASERPKTPEGQVTYNLDDQGRPICPGAPRRKKIGSSASTL